MGMGRRTRRLGHLIQAELAEAILRRVRDARLKEASLTGVDVAPDLSQAKVYFSVLDPERAPAVLEAFQSAAGFLRRELAGKLHIKTIPRLVPVYDRSLNRGAEMDKIIAQVRSEDEAAAQERGDEENGS